MSREDLIEQRLERGIRRISNNADEFKSRQRSSGASGQRGYSIESDQDWDLTQELPTTAAYDFQPVELIVTFTGEASRPFPIFMPATDIRFNGTAESNKPTRRANGDYFWPTTSATDMTQMDQWDEPVTTLLGDQFVLEYRVNFYYTGTITYYVKARGQASSNGVLTVTRVF